MNVLQVFDQNLSMFSKTFIQILQDSSMQAKRILLGVRPAISTITADVVDQVVPVAKRPVWKTTFDVLSNKKTRI